MHLSKSIIVRLENSTQNCRNGNAPVEKHHCAIGEFHAELQKRKCTCRKASLSRNTVCICCHDCLLLVACAPYSVQQKISNHSFSSCAAPYYLTNQIISQLLIKLLTPQHSQSPIFLLKLLGNLGNHTRCISVFFGPEKHTYTPCMVTRITKHFH